MSVLTRHAPGRELRAGVESALQGLSSLAMPSLLFAGLLGPLAAAPGLWATLMAVTLVPALRILLGGLPSIVSAPRTASTATYVALVLHLAQAASGQPLGSGSATLTLQQLQLGLAAGSLIYLIASLLIVCSGLLRMGRVFKMIPTPVTTGISNGTALILLLLVAGKMREGGALAALVAAAMLLVYYGWVHLQQRSSRALRLPAILLAVAIGYSCAALLQGAQAGPEQGLGLGAATQWPALRLWQFLDGAPLGALLMQGLPGAVTLALVMVLETFTAASVMEIRFGVRSQADRELLALGGANLLGAVLGGVPCTGSSVYSTVSWLAGGRARLAALLCCAGSAALLLCFNQQLMALPLGIAAGLLVLQAALMVNPSFVRNLRDIVRGGRWYRPVTQDLGFWIAVVISLVGFFGNLIWACFAGVGLSCLAVLRRVSVNLTAHWLYLDALRSRRIRTRAESDALSHLARDVGVLRLSGHLFFGNSARIMQLADELEEGCACVVIDVSLVQDADPSGLDAIAWLLRALRERGVRVVLSGLEKTRTNNLRAALGELLALEQAVDLDRGLERCEDWILRESTALPAAQTSLPIEQNSLLHGLSADEVTAVLMVAEVRQVQQGETLFRKDERSDGVWMLQSGQVSILAGMGPQATRLATFGPGQFVGEMGFIDGNTRSATATADAPVHAVLLDNQAIAALVRDHANAALQITRNIARELSQRVRSTSAVLAQEAEAPHSAWTSSVLGMASKAAQ